jgi:uncharacterized membrane protein (UPF0127 family)
MSGTSRRQGFHARLLVLLGIASLLVACGDGKPPPVDGARLPVAWLVVGGHRVTSEIAAQPDDRQQGLMFRESMPGDHGMLFVFPREQVLSFWMRNTTLPLSIAFADAAGKIVRIADLEPLDESPVTSVGPARYALEMNRGWFREHGVAVGAAIEGTPTVAGR